MRCVARQFRVSLATVQRWVQRAEGNPLDQIDGSDTSHAPHQPPRQTDDRVQERIVEARAFLRQHSDLGEYGAQAIRLHLLAQPDLSAAQVPGTATINRILRAHGQFDAKRRIRRPSPPSGWYLPEVGAQRADIDAMDVGEGLFLEGGQERFALHLIALHGGGCATWLVAQMRAVTVKESLLAHWRAYGLPAYAQFDNGSVCLGAPHLQDSLGRVSRLCLSLGVIPVFAVPREFGIQSAIASYNARWQRSVWQRFVFSDAEQARLASSRYGRAVHQRTARRQEIAPGRRAFPCDWQEPTTLARTGQIMFLRRTDEQGAVSVLGHSVVVAAHWCHRLVRCEVDLASDQIRLYGLRRQAPTEQPLLKTWDYRLPDKSCKASRQFD